MRQVSIIVPIYNVELYLARCVESLINQTCDKDKYEVILINDGSTDSSGKIADEYAMKYPNTVSVIHQENTGLGGARNTGIESVNSEYIMFIDSDDYVASTMVETLLNKISKEKADIVICEYQRVDENGSIIEVHKEDLEENKCYNPSKTPEILLVDNSACNKIYRRELFVNNSINYPQRAWFEDLRTTLKLLLASTKIFYIKKPFYNYFVRTGSIMNTPNHERQIEIKYAIDDILSYAKENNYYSSYYNELEFICIAHLYIYGLNRIIMINRKSHFIQQFKSFMREEFPEYKNNKYIDKLPKKEKLFFSLINARLYSVLYFIHKIKDKVK